MTEPTADEGTLAHHLSQLAITAEDLRAMLEAPQEAAIHPEALVKSAKLAVSLKDVIYALTHHEHLAMHSDDVWRALSADHKGSSDGTFT